MSGAVWAGKSGPVRPLEGLEGHGATLGPSGALNGPQGPCGAFRVLVTGSRDWNTPKTVHAALDTVAAEHPGEPLVVVNGGCKTGADAAAAVWARRAERDGWQVTEEPHPADWKRHGRSAGPLRNRLMVEAGADLVLAFVVVGPGKSRGTRGTIELAIGAGIPVRRYEASEAAAR